MGKEERQIITEESTYEHICDKCFALRGEGGVNGSTKMGPKEVEEGSVAGKSSKKL